MKRLVLRLLAVAALLAAVVRAAAPEPITHEATEKKSSVTLRVADTLKIVLPPRTEAGYRWQIVSNDPRIIRPQGDAKPAASGRTADGAVPWEIAFVALRPGRSSVRFVWAKEGETGIATSDEIREVNVRVQ